MDQKKVIAIALLVIGAALLLFGLNAMNAPAEEVTEALTGRYTDRTMIYLIGGVIAAVIGVVMLVRK